MQAAKLYIFSFWHSQWDDLSDAMDDRPLLGSSLPLVFVKGQPRDLTSLNVRELQRFLRLVLHCDQTIGLHDSLDIHRRPPWWLQAIPFDDSLFEISRRRGEQGMQLRSLIRKCYACRGQEHLLRASSNLMQRLQKGSNDATGNLSLVDNRNGTMSYRNESQGINVVTFKKHNYEYDLDQFTCRSPLRSNQRLKPNQSDPRLPLVEDDFRCDWCLSNFLDVQGLLAHEKQCVRRKANLGTLTNNAHLLSFFSALGMVSSKDQCIEKENISKVDRSITRLQSDPITIIPKVPMRRKPSSLKRFAAVDFSSPLGPFITQKLSIEGAESPHAPFINQPINHSITEKGDAINTDVTHKALEVRSARRPVPIVTPKHIRSQPRDHRVHQYCFNRDQREHRRCVLETGLSPLSYALLLHCRRRRPLLRLRRCDNLVTKPLRVVLRKLSLPVLSHRLGSELPKAKTPILIDLCSSSDEDEHQQEGDEEREQLYQDNGQKTSAVIDQSIRQVMV